MTRKDYVKIAAVFETKVDYLRKTGVADTPTQAAARQEKYFVVKNIVDELCDVFVTDNPNFKKDVFLKACGVK